MDDRKNTENSCLNNFTLETFNESFGVDDLHVKKCNNCPNMIYDNGILGCKKFNNL